MATEISICNLALAHLGDEATVASIDPPEGSAQGTHCATFYPMARDALQDTHAWEFCTTRATLSLLSAAPLSGWLYAYARPSAAVKILGLFLPGSADDSSPQAYETEILTDGAKVIYSNTAAPVCRYTIQVTDPSKFPPLFVLALSWLLASHLAGPLLKGKTGAAKAKDCLTTAAAYLAQAKGSDANQRSAQPKHNVPWIMNR